MPGLRRAVALNGNLFEILGRPLGRSNRSVPRYKARLPLTIKPQSHLERRKHNLGRQLQRHLGPGTKAHGAIKRHGVPGAEATQQAHPGATGTVYAMLHDRSRHPLTQMFRITSHMPNVPNPGNTGPPKGRDMGPVAHTDHTAPPWRATK